MLYSPYNALERRHEARNQEDRQLDRPDPAEGIAGRCSVSSRATGVDGRRDWRTGACSFGASDPVFDKGMEIAEKAMDTYRNALEELGEMTRAGLADRSNLVLAIHERQLAGVRRRRPGDPRLRRARSRRWGGRGNRWAYETRRPSRRWPPPTLSASRSNHPFVDGNKRTALLVDDDVSGPQRHRLRRRRS